MSVAASLMPYSPISSMKDKRYKTKEKIRILRKADGNKNIVEVCLEHNISEVTFQKLEDMHIY